MRKSHPSLKKRFLLLYTFVFSPLCISAQQPAVIISDSPCLSTFCLEGVAAFKAFRYEEAVQNFRKAVELNPSSQQAHLYLGTALAIQVVPNLQSPENLEIASSALSEFDVVLKMDPNNVIVLSQEAMIYRETQKLEKARDREKEVVSLDPRNAEALYNVGVIDWQQVYKNSVTVLAKEGLSDDGMGNPKLSNAGCDALEMQNAILVDDALDSLNKAIKLNPKYDDAMQYLNLIYRRRGEIHCHDRAAAQMDIAIATQWSEQAMKTRRANQAGSK